MIHFALLCIVNAERLVLNEDGGKLKEISRDSLVRLPDSLAATLRGATVYVARPAPFIPRLRSK